MLFMHVLFLHHLRYSVLLMNTKAMHLYFTEMWWFALIFIDFFTHIDYKVNLPDQSIRKCTHLIFIVFDCSTVAFT